MAVTCIECGEKVDARATFCPACLASVNTEPASNPAAQSPPIASFMSQPAGNAAATVPKSNAHRIIIATLAAVLLLGGIAFAVWSIAKKPPGPDDVDTAAVAPEIVKFAISDANIRSLATAKGPDTRVVGTIRRGEQVKGTMQPSLRGGGYWLKLSDGRGYVSAVNLSDAAPAENAPPPPVAGGTRAPVKGAPFCQVATKTGNLRIRSSPNGPIVGGMPKGARFQAFNNEYDDAGGEWYQVQPFETRYPNGWVSAAFIDC
jgi:hypothetical protein